MPEGRRIPVRKHVKWVRGKRVDVRRHERRVRNPRSPNIPTSHDRMVAYVLKNSRNWMSTNEVSEASMVGWKTTILSLKKLRGKGLVYRKARLNRVEWKWKGLKY